MNRICLYVTPYFPTGTDWRGGYSVDAVRELERSGYETVVLVLSPQAKQIASARSYGIAYRLLPRRDGPCGAFPWLFARENRRAFRHAIEDLDRERVECVRLNTVACAVYAAVAGELFPHARKELQLHQSGRPVSWNCGRFGYVPMVSELLRRHWRRTVSDCDALLFVSAIQRERGERMKFLPSGIPRRVVHNPVDRSLFAALPRTPHDAFTIGCVANFVKWKRQCDLLRALARLRPLAQSSGRRLHCVFVGSGPALAACRRLARRLGLADIVEFRGECPHSEMPALYRSFDLLVLPSEGEAFGSVCAEARACGTPFAVSSDAGVAETLGESERRRLTFPPRDTAAIARVLADVAGIARALAWWTVFPTPNQRELVRALRARGVDAVACYFGEYDAYRKSLGWTAPPLEPWEYRVGSPEAAASIVPDFATRIQMVPGSLSRFGRRLMSWCARNGADWFAVTEASRGRLRSRPFLSAFARRANRSALAVFGHGRRALAQLRDFGVDASMLEWLGYAIPPPDATLVRREPETDGCTFVFAGALSNRKGADLLAAAWRIVRATVPSARLRLLGSGECADRFAGLEGVEMTGPLPPERIFAAMSGGSVIVLPSRYDPWGVALTEGAALGLAMVATDACGAAELIRPGENGELASAGSAEALARAMLVYARDPQLAFRHGQLARQSVGGLFGEPLAERVVRMLNPPTASAAPVVASFWEEHCTECGEPECFLACPLFERSWCGRCRRIDAAASEKPVGASCFRETVRGGAEVRLRPWGKLELIFHGTVMSPRLASAVERTCRLLGRVAWMFPKPFRSLRWRLTRRLGWPAIGRRFVWRLDCTAERDERLVAQVVAADGREIFRRPVILARGDNRLGFALPPLPVGVLLRLFAADGGETGWLRFRENAVAVDLAADFETVKVLAWDLDGTLWDGILSEVGIDGLRLRPEAVDLLTALESRGIASSIVSRNDPETALAALRRFGLESSFVFPQFGWSGKSAGLAALAKAMNLGLDAIAIVDDLAEVRNEVTAALPEVRTYGADEIPTLADRREFTVAPSPEGASRVARYREEMVRRGALYGKFDGDVAAFLRDSSITFELLDVAGERMLRCRELVQRTNQLNLTGRRYDESEFCRLVATTECRAVRVSDRYGDYGTVGFVAWRGTHFVELCFSCRVAGKGVERRVLAAVAEGRTMTADVVVTERNEPIRRIVAEFFAEGRTK